MAYIGGFEERKEVLKGKRELKKEYEPGNRRENCEPHIGRRGISAGTTVRCVIGTHRFDHGTGRPTGEEEKQPCAEGGRRGDCETSEDGSVDCSRRRGQQVSMKESSAFVHRRIISTAGGT